MATEPSDGPSIVSQAATNIGIKWALVGLAELTILVVVDFHPVGRRHVLLLVAAARLCRRDLAQLGLSFLHVKLAFPLSAASAERELRCFVRPGVW